MTDTGNGASARDVNAALDTAARLYAMALDPNEWVGVPASPGVANQSTRHAFSGERADAFDAALATIRARIAELELRCEVAIGGGEKMRQRAVRAERERDEALTEQREAGWVNWDKHRTVRDERDVLRAENERLRRIEEAARDLKRYMDVWQAGPEAQENAFGYVVSDGFGEVIGMVNRVIAALGATTSTEPTPDPQPATEKP